MSAQAPILYNKFKNTLLKLFPDLPGANELLKWGIFGKYFDIGYLITKK